jgi:hypothetical protein
MVEMIFLEGLIFLAQTLKYKNNKRPDKIRPSLYLVPEGDTAIALTSAGGTLKLSFVTLILPIIIDRDGLVETALLE